MQLPMSNSLTAQILNSNESKKNSDGKKSSKNSKSISIKIRTVSGADSLILIESVKTNSSKSYSYSRVTTRRFASAHAVGVGNVKPFEFSGVNSSAVISAWSLSSPSEDFFAADTDIHGEFGADLRNLIPTDSDFAKWVSDCDSLIENSHLGADKCEVKEIADQQRPTQGRNETITSFYKKTLCREASAKKITETSEEVTTSCAVDLRISHVNSLSRKVVR